MLCVPKEVKNSMAEGYVLIGSTEDRSKEMIVNLAEAFRSEYHVWDGFNEGKEFVIIRKIFHGPQDRPHVSVFRLVKCMLYHCLCERGNRAT
jgi:hypothetical protein